MGGGFDEDVLTAIVFGLIGFAVAVYAMRLFRRGHAFWGIGAAAIAAVFLFAAYFFAVFQMRMF